MSNLGPIHTYRSEVDQIIRFSGSTMETAIRGAVFNLINAYARPRDLLLIPELDYFNPRRKKRVTPGGTLKNILRLDYGFWESKGSRVASTLGWMPQPRWGNSGASAYPRSRVPGCGNELLLQLRADTPLYAAPTSG